MKGMLVKTKKELAEAKKQVRVLPKAKERISFCSLVPTFRERSVEHLVSNKVPL